MAAMDAAAANLSTDGPTWLGPYALDGPEGEAALALARDLRSARRRERVSAKTYVIPPEPLDMRAWHTKVGRGAGPRWRRAGCPAPAARLAGLPVPASTAGARLPRPPVPLVAPRSART